VEDRHFEVDGRFAVRFRADGGSGRIAWTHLPQSDDLTISNPLGQGIARIVRRDGIFTLTTSQGRIHSATDPDQLTERVLGWALPLSGLPFWLRGHPAPGHPSEAAGDNPGRPTELRQSGWTIEYLSRHQPNGLPERLRIRRGDLDIRLVLEEWRAVP
jgi:outer membrane lipoprotein LolB